MPRCAMSNRPSPKDGKRIDADDQCGACVMMLGAIALTGADGIGLFRTEFQFLISATLPQRERQQRFYREVLDAAGDKPVIFRTTGCRR